MHRDLLLALTVTIKPRRSRSPPSTCPRVEAQCRHTLGARVERALESDGQGSLAHEQFRFDLIMHRLDSRLATLYLYA